MAETEDRKIGTISRPTENLEVPEEDEREICFPLLSVLQGWRAFFGMLFIGSPILLFPAVYIILKDGSKQPDLYSTDTDTIQKPFNQAVRWSILLTLVWVAFICYWWGLLLMPTFIVHFVTGVYGKASQQLRTRLDFITAIRPWLAFTMTTITAVIGFRIVFFQLDQIEQWNSIFKCLLVIMVLSIIFLSQRIFVQMVAFNFHKVAYEDRLKQVQATAKSLEKLQTSIKGFGLVDIFDFRDSNDHEIASSTDENVSDQPASWWSRLIHKRSKLKVPDHQTPIDIKIEQHTDTVKNWKRSSANGNKQKTILGNQDKGVMGSGLHIGGTAKPKSKLSHGLSSDKHAVELAASLFEALHNPEDAEIHQQAFLPFFENEEESKKAFALFDKDGNGSINAREMKWAIIRIYRERRDLTYSLNDLSNALGNLNRILYVFSIIISSLLSMPIYGIALTAILPFTSILVALSFIFGSAARSTFDCIIFLFVTHPYDSGALP